MSQNVVVSTTLDDTSTNVTYAGGNWTTHTNVESIFHLFDNTDTFASDQGATATLHFYGTAIDYWGNQGPYHGPCKITIDGTDVATVNSHAAVDDDPILLYSNNNLQLGDHTLVITIVDPAYPNTCEVDRFVVNTTSSVTYTSAYAYTGPGSTPTGGSVPSGNVANNGSNNNNNNNGTSNKSSSPPVAAIAGAVGGVAALALLILVWWWYRRSKRNKPNTMATLRKNTEQIKPFLAEGGLTSPSELEKSPFPPARNGTRQEYANRPPSSYMSSSPPPSTYPTSSPPPSTVGYNNYPFGPTPTIPPTSVGHAPSPPGSPPPSTRPMSTISSAPTASYYTNQPLSTEGGGFPGHVQQQPAPVSTIAPVWATPAPGPTTGYQPVPTEPSPSPSPAPVAVPVVVAAAATASSSSDTPANQAYEDSRRPEKARYTGSQAPPEKARFTGSSSASQTSGGASSSSAGPSVDTTAAVASGSGQPNRNDTLSPVPEAPPPAYQI